MTGIRQAQAELYALMKQQVRHPFFLHGCRSGNALWVSDILYRNPDFPLKLLSDSGYATEISGNLLLISFSKQQWQILIASLENCEPCFCGIDGFSEELYALSRLLLAHPHTADTTDFQLFASVYRLEALPPDLRRKEIKKCLHTASERLRQGRLRCYPGGQLTALWLQKGVFS